MYSAHEERLRSVHAGTLSTGVMGGHERGKIGPRSKGQEARAWRAVGELQATRRLKGKVL